MSEDSNTLDPALTHALLAAIYEATGLLAPTLYESETLEILQREKQTDGSEKIRFRYHFDEDHFSQYDKTVTFNGWLTWHAGQAKVTEFFLEHRGEAAHYTLPAPKTNQKTD